MSPAARIVLLQCLLGGICTLIFLVLGQARSALLATVCVVVPTLYYAWVQARTYNATRILAHGVMRMLVTAMLMAVSIVVVGIEPVGFFVTFAVMQGAYFVRGN